MEAQAFTIDQPFQGAYEKFIEITSHLSAKAQGEQTHSEIEAYLETDGRERLCFHRRGPPVLGSRYVVERFHSPKPEVLFYGSTSVHD